MKTRGGGGLDDNRTQQATSLFSLETKYLGNEGSKKPVPLQILTWADPSKRSMEEKALGLIFPPRFSVLLCSRQCRKKEQGMFMKNHGCKSPKS